jgi:hypothetical protein
MNTLLKPVQYKIEHTPWGTWKRFGYESGNVYEEFTSFRQFWGLPLLHYTRGRHPETGRLKTAKGIIAIGRRAIGCIAIGQLAIGLFFGLGQAACGLLCVGQGAVGLLVAGQVAVGIISVGQIAIGIVAIGQMAVGIWGWGMAQHTTHSLSQFYELITDAW